MTPEDLLSPGQHPGIEVPAKPGPAQFREVSVGRVATDGDVGGFD
jgi:hypothetical protein